MLLNVHFPQSHFHRKSQERTVQSNDQRIIEKFDIEKCKTHPERCRDSVGGGRSGAFLSILYILSVPVPFQVFFFLSDFYLASVS